MKKQNENKAKQCQQQRNPERTHKQTGQQQQ